MSPGAKAWCELAAFVIAADAILMWNGEKTMSEVFAGGLADPNKRWWIIGIWAILTFHLHREMLPNGAGKIDPLTVGRVAGKKLWYRLFGEG